MKPCPMWSSVHGLGLDTQAGKHEPCEHGPIATGAARPSSPGAPASTGSPGLRVSKAPPWGLGPFAEGPSEIITLEKQTINKKNPERPGLDY